MSVVISSSWAVTLDSRASRCAPGKARPLRSLRTQRVHVGAQARQRGAQLVAGVRDQLRLPDTRLGEGGDYRVERVGEPGTSSRR
jgi:hypothetical protein